MEKYGPVCDADFKCPGWEKGMKEIEAAQIYCSFRPGAPKYTAPKIKFCPWCGNKIIQPI